MHICEELVYTTTMDGFEHAGVVIRPDSVPAAPIGVIWVHGAGANFYMRPYILLARALAAHGYLSVLGNNRGHDFGFWVDYDGERPIYAGQGWELFEDVHHDLTAWIDFTCSLGFAQVVLLGHSLGAAKVPYYQAHQQDPRVCGLVLASAPATLARQSQIPDLLSQAEQMVAEGRGHHLLPWACLPSKGTLSAQTYLNRARSMLDIVGLDTTDPLVARITCPILAFYGTNEVFVGTEKDLERIVENATRAKSVETHIFKDADHCYTGQEQIVMAVTANWINGL